MKYDILTCETLFQGYYRLDRYKLQHERFDGSTRAPLQREVFERGRGVAGVLLFDPQADCVVLVEQFRTGPMARGDDPWTTEIVCGMLDSNETPEQTARRETQEETGCTVAELQPIAKYYTSPGGTSEYIYLYAGRVEAPPHGTTSGCQTEHEDIRVHVLDAAKAIGLLYANKVQDAQTMVALQWFAMHHTELRSRWLLSEVGTPII